MPPVHLQQLRYATEVCVVDIDIQKRYTRGHATVCPAAERDASQKVGSRHYHRMDDLIVLPQYRQWMESQADVCRRPTGKTVRFQAS